jgi:hypothetical protein
MSGWSNWKKNLGDSRPWHLLDPKQLINDTKIVESRMSICNACPHLVQATKQCTKCGCFMVAKTKLKNAECPLGFWSKESL